MSGGDPVVVGFLCSWCAYRAADAQGPARIPTASGLRPVLVPCTSRVDPEAVLTAFREGADGVLVAGCHPDACHFLDGSAKAAARAVLLRGLLRQLGVEGERLQFVCVSAVESAALAAATERMIGELRRLGPLRWPQTALRREVIG